MDTVGTVEMWKALSKYKLLTCLHKFVNMDEVIQVCEDGEADPNYVMLSTGIGERDYKMLHSNMAKLEKHKINI